MARMEVVASRVRGERCWAAAVLYALWAAAVTAEDAHRPELISHARRPRAPRSARVIASLVIAAAVDHSGRRGHRFQSAAGAHRAALAQVAASVPATALFPVVLLGLIRLGGGLGMGSILLMLLGTQWYVLFNVIAGAMAIPTELREVARCVSLSEHGSAGAP